MKEQVIPTKPGQVVIKKGEKNEQYLIIDEPIAINHDQTLKVCSVTELQRATAAKRHPNFFYVKKGDLSVIAEDLQSFVDSWKK